jgi:SAM-dependent methyltransferase
MPRRSYNLGQRLLAFCSAALHKLRHEGVTGVSRACVNMLREWYRAKRARIGSRFDQEFGTDTEGVVRLWKLDINSQHRNEGIRYQTMDPNSVRAAIENLPIKPEEFVYVDLGSGKGRTLLIASEYPFRRVVGVEFSLELHTIATENIRRYLTKRKCENVSSFNIDATTYDFPPDNMVIFLYNPFGETVFRRVLENLKISLAQNDQQVYIIYFNPVFAPLLDSSAFLERIEVPIPPGRSYVSGSVPAAIYQHGPGSQALA